MMSVVQVSSREMLAETCIIMLLLQRCFSVDLTYHVEEEKNSGTYIGNIAADSLLMDSVALQDHGQITFNQLQQRQSERAQLFNVSKTGKLYTTEKIDAEVLCTYNTECFRIIKVAVHRADSFMQILKIKVYIEDVNDNYPVFPKESISIEFSEEHSKGVKRSLPNAIDRDVSFRNSQVSYVLEKNLNEPFTLSVTKRGFGTSELGIVLEESLDREIKDTYMLQVIAKDGGVSPRQGVLKVQISVIDVNDNPPVFSDKVYNVSIKNTHRTSVPIIILSAKDLDYGKNSQVSYHFSSKTSEGTKKQFRLDENSGEVFLRGKVSSNRISSLKLYIDATDGGNPPLSSIALVLVNIVSQQNNAPTIEINFVSRLKENVAAISEGIKVGSFIAYVNVIDNDIGLNGEVDCEITHEKFQLLNLGSNEYKIIMKKQVDREVKEFYDIQLICQDKGSPSLKTVRKFSIQVMDVNDVQPQFTKDTFKFLTYENEKPSFPVGFINATDPDLGDGGRLTYYLTGNRKKIFPFEITNNGFISTIQSLDREQQDIYEFKVFVKDNGSPSLNNTANVIVEVMDENDNAPYFTFPSVNPFNLDVHYHPQSKNDITVIRASDRDRHVNSFLKYEIVGGNNKHLFTVNPYAGVLSFSRTVYQNDAGSYNLLLVVKDSGSPVLSATTTLSLTLTVSNKTAKIQTTVQLQSEDMIDINWVIVIAVIAVLLAVAVAVFVTMCIVKCNNINSHNQNINPKLHIKKEKRLLISRASTPGTISSNPGTITRTPEGERSRNIQATEVGNQLYPGSELQNEWRSSCIARGLLPSSQYEACNLTSGKGGVEEGTFMTLDQNSGLETSYKNNRHGWIKGENGLYEEIPAFKRM
ncbi:protocadherin beta-2 isoform X1 [Octopus sinensis]|uniref:Protocadherin beta-2 isoform X1 n=1 Tax=Octopus sinensis TaxID=2607531 RepID=A0A7E6F9U4_9MOLL|nr:protocadherin beta-2 isoform X1 [Octopus sinensis]